MDAATSLLQWARKIQAIAQNGLTFTQDPFDRERYQQLQELVTTILTSHLAITPEQLQGLWLGDDGYATPKVDVRGGVFDQDKVLLVRERSDGGGLFREVGSMSAMGPPLRSSGRSAKSRVTWQRPSSSRPSSTRTIQPTVTRPASFTSTSCFFCVSS